MGRIRVSGEIYPSHDNKNPNRAGFSQKGLDHAAARQYAAWMGRWTAPDPYMGSYDITNPQSFNRYTYANNNPLSFVDPSGLAGGPATGGGSGSGCAPSDASCQGYLYYGDYWASLYGQSAATWQAYNNPTYNVNWYTLGYNSAGMLVVVSNTFTVTLNSLETNPNDPALLQASAGSSAAQNIPAPNNGLPTPSKFKATIPGTNYCGPGGSGTPTDQTDAACAAHDLCYQNAGATFRNNIPFWPTSAQQRAAMQACDGNLCSTLNSNYSPTSAEAGQATLVETYFGCSGGYSLR